VNLQRKSQFNMSVINHTDLDLSLGVPWLYQSLYSLQPDRSCSKNRLAFAAADQRRRSKGGLSSRRFATASMTAKLSSLDLGADCKPSSREESSRKASPASAFSETRGQMDAYERTLLSR
jgi:hypothetical protein